MTKDEIKDIISHKLSEKIRKDLDETRINNMMSKDNIYVNNLFHNIIREYMLENYEPNIKLKAKEAIDKISIEYILGHTWDRAQHPESINNLKGMQIINSIFEKMIPDIKIKLTEIFIKKSDEELYDMFSEQFGNLMHKAFISKLNELNKQNII